MNWKTLALAGGIALAAVCPRDAAAQMLRSARNTSTTVKTVVSPSSTGARPTRRVQRSACAHDRARFWPEGRGYLYGGFGYPDNGYPFGYGPWSYHYGYPYPGSPAARYYDPYYKVEYRSIR